jgi:hypothetical protein
MNRKKKPKADISRKLLIERLQPEEALRVLQRLLAAHPELEMEAEGIAKSLLRDADFEVIADDICDAIQTLGYEQLQGARDARRGATSNRTRLPPIFWARRSRRFSTI